jgi:hypothetical protein
MCANYALLIRLVLIISALPGLSYGQTISIFDDFLRRYEAAPVSAKAQLMQSFIDRQRKSGGFPITEADGTVIFVYVGASGERDVRLTGDFRQKSFSDVYWDTVGEPMARVGSVFYYRHKFETDALLDYKFIVDGKDLRDPLNARTIVSGTGGGEVSELVMPRHSSFSTATTQDGTAHGTLHVLEEAWAKPKVTIYMPPGYDECRKYKLAAG